MTFDEYSIFQHSCKNIIQLYAVLLTIYNTFHTKTQPEVPSHIKVTIELLGSVVCKFRNRKVKTQNFLNPMSENESFTIFSAMTMNGDTAFTNIKHMALCITSHADSSLHATPL
jgi:hypothetical protein